VSELLTFGALGLKIVQQEKTNADDRVCREQSWPTPHAENAKREDYRTYSQGHRWKRKKFRYDNSYRSHERQTNKWLSRRVEQFHALTFSLIPLLQGKL